MTLSSYQGPSQRESSISPQLQNVLGMGDFGGLGKNLEVLIGLLYLKAIIGSGLKP